MTLTGTDGLIVTGPQISTTNGGYDWDLERRAKTGTVTAFNHLYYQSLRDVAYIEASLGTPRGRRVRTGRRPCRGRDQREPADPAAGTYYLSDADHSTFAEDANALSVLFGVAQAAEGARHPQRAEDPGGRHGSEPFSGTTYSNLISRTSPRTRSKPTTWRATRA